MDKEKMLEKFRREDTENRERNRRAYRAMRYVRKPKRHSHCLWCRKRISVYRQATAKYCSKKCSYSATAKKHSLRYGGHSNSSYRNLIIAFLGNCCIKCNSLDKLQVDHKIPRHLGGQNIMENIQILCITCHKEKTSKEMEDFNRKIASKNTLKTKDKKRRKNTI